MDIKTYDKNNFMEYINYIINQLESNLNNIDKLDEDFYFEMSKEQIIKSFKDVLLKIKKWKESFEKEDYLVIQNEYKNIESEISELELCLLDLDNIFHLEGISYSLYKMGEIMFENRV